MHTFTVVGYWPDSDQRFCTWLTAATASAAERQCLDEHPGISVCAVFDGKHAAVDTDPCVLHSDS